MTGVLSLQDYLKDGKGILRMPIHFDHAHTPTRAVTVGTSATKILDRNTARLYASVMNDDATSVVYLSLNNAPVLNSGGGLNTGRIDVFEVGLWTNLPWTGEVWGIAAANAVVLVMEL